MVLENQIQLEEKKKKKENEQNHKGLHFNQGVEKYILLGLLVSNAVNNSFSIKYISEEKHRYL